MLAAARTTMMLCTVLIAASVTLGPLLADDAPGMLLEVRRAQREPAAGLQRAEVPGRPGRVIYLHPKVELTNADVDEASVGHTEFGDIAIDLTMTAAGAKKLEELTASNLDRPLAILINGTLVCAPNIASKISKQAQIVGNFTEDEAERIAGGIVGRKAP